MSKKIRVTEDYVRDIADAIRDKKEVEDKYSIKEMAGAVESIPTSSPIDNVMLRYACDINTSKSVDAGEENIRTNASKCAISFAENKITVEDEGLIAYVGGNVEEPRKWVGILVDLNKRVQGDTYNIEDVDYTEAKRWGAGNNTTFIMWLTVEGGDRTITFTSTEDETDSIELTVEFVEE